jgi:hypothetical protein
VNKLAELLNKEIRNISMIDLNDLWDATIEERARSWYDELAREIEDSMQDLDFESDRDHNLSPYPEDGLQFRKGGVLCTIYIGYPEICSDYDCFLLSAVLERDTSISTTYSFDIEADTITELLLEIQTKAEQLGENSEI